MTPRISRHALALSALAVLGCALLAWHAWRYMPFISDDALISLRYTRNLLDGHGLVWNPGERVEGYSNLLWVLLTALLGTLGVDLIDTTRALGLASMSAALVALVYAQRRADHWAPAALSALMWAASAPVAVWAIGGLEQGLVVATLAWAVVTSAPLTNPNTRPTLRACALPGACLAALCLTRPDGALLSAALGGGVVLARVVGAPGARLKAARGGLSAALALGLLPGLAWGGQLVFRLAYYGDWVPNTAHAKLGPSWTRAQGGLDYLLSAVSSVAPLALLGLLGLGVALASAARRRRAVVLLALALAWAAYVVVIGGDIFPGYRHALVLLMLLALGLGEGVRALLPRLSARQRLATVAAFVLLCLPWAGWMQARDHHNDRAKHERWEWDGQVIGTLLRDLFAERDALLAVDPAGTLPYWSQLRSVDMLGLNDRYLATHPPDDFGQGPLAHELGDGDYILERAPDLVLFCLPGGSPAGCFRSGHELVANPRFHDLYHLVHFHGDTPHPFTSQLWVRHDSPRIGVTRTPSSVRLPPWLWEGHLGHVVRSPDGGALRLAPRASVAFHRLQLDAGAWDIALPPNLTLKATRARALTHHSPLNAQSHAKFTATQAPGDRFVRLRVTRAGALDLSLTNPSADAPAHIGPITLTRAP